jgi:hypothetical protein
MRGSPPRGAPIPVGDRGSLFRGCGARTMQNRGTHCAIGHGLLPGIGRPAGASAQRMGPRGREGRWSSFDQWRRSLRAAQAIGAAPPGISLSPCGSQVSGLRTWTSVSGSPPRRLTLLKGRASWEARMSRQGMPLQGGARPPRIADTSAIPAVASPRCLPHHVFPRTIQEHPGFNCGAR